MIFGVLGQIRRGVSVPAHFCSLTTYFARDREPSSPYINRFLQPDSIIPSPSNPQSWNRYSYVINNPVRYTDPSGRCWKELGGHKVWFSDSSPECGSTAPIPKPNFSPKPNYGLEFKGEGGDGDKEDFETAVAQEAARQYEVFCPNPAMCEFATPAELYRATHGTTVITFSNSSVAGYFCERNTNVGEEGVICYSNSRGDITPVIAAHEVGHWFNYLVTRNGYIMNDPYHDLANEQLNNKAFPAPDVDITPGHLTNQKAISGNNGDDFANMYSMWVLEAWTETTGNRERKKFMEDNMYTWILRTLYPGP